MRRIAFLLGAGASKALGSDVNPGTPPLMRDLYEELARAFPKDWGAGSPLEKYRDQFKNDFEQTFTEVVLRITKDYGLPGPSLSLLEGERLLALYFSRFVLGPTGTDYYSKLLKALRSSGDLPHTIFGSLNYECLLEQAAQNLGLYVKYEGSDFRPDTVHVAKLHGSCNFVAHIGQVEKSLLAGTSVAVEVPLDILSLHNLDKILADKFGEQKDSYLPVMSLVSRYKEQFLAPVRIQQMRNPWDARVHDAECVAIVGVSFNLHDHHIINPIESAPGKVYVGDDGSFKKWHALNTRTEHVDVTLESGFDELLTRIGVI
jgi:hypothetical protein